MNPSPTYAELKNPEKLSSERLIAAKAAAASAPLDPANLDNLRRHDGQLPMPHVLVPSEMTGTSAPIAMVTGNSMPTGTHHAGAAWACLAEGITDGTITPGTDCLIIPDTGGWGFSAAAVARLMGFDSEVIASNECHPMLEGALESVGTTLTRTTNETIVSTAYGRGEHRLVLDLNHNPAAWRYHAEITAAALEDLSRRLHKDHVGRGCVDVFVAELSGAGILGAGARLRMSNDAMRVVGVRTPSARGPAINDGVPYLTDVAKINEAECRRYLEGMRDAADLLVEEAFIPMEPLDDVVEVIGLNGMRNVFAASMMARQLALDHTSLVICTSSGQHLEPAPLLDASSPFNYDEVMQVIASLHDGDPSCVEDAGSLAQELADALPAHPMGEPNTMRDAAFWEQIIAKTTRVDEAIEKIRSQ